MHDRSRLSLSLGQVRPSPHLQHLNQGMLLPMNPMNLGVQRTIIISSLNQPRPPSSPPPHAVNACLVTPLSLFSFLFTKAIASCPSCQLIFMRATLLGAPGRYNPSFRRRHPLSQVSLRRVPPPLGLREPTTTRRHYSTCPIGLFLAVYILFLFILSHI